MALFKQNLFLFSLLLLYRNLSMHFDYFLYVKLSQCRNHTSQDLLAPCAKFPAVKLRWFLLLLQMCEGVNFPVSSRICDKITQKYLLCGNINKHGSSLSELKFLWLFMNQISGLCVCCPMRCRLPNHRDLALLNAALTVPHSSVHSRCVPTICRKNR